MKLRMYFFVPYNISEIQKGIQAGHCAVEYARKYGGTQLFKDFATKNKTWIILNGGTTRDYDGVTMDCGDMNEIEKILYLNKIEHATFREPDLNHALTAVCFIADERVWDLETYPDFEEIQAIPNNHQWILPRTEETWLVWIGGHKNRILRDLIRDKRLA